MAVHFLNGFRKCVGHSSLSPCLSLSLSLLCPCCCPVGSLSCTHLLVRAFGCCLSVPLKLLPPNVARVFPCSSWLVHACLRGWSGVGWGGVVVGGRGGGFGLRVLCPEVLLLCVLCHKLPLVAPRWLSEPSLDHHRVCVALAFRSVSCSYGRFVLLGDMCLPGCLVFGGVLGRLPTTQVSLRGVWRLYLRY